ncbi:hypothetical protein [Novosphingobium guangzhouense]|uniref:hypothetical protein n=1 Tax=Novosphingobium guangzhouense TaxID=1850347 RepID=UPI0011AFA81C|nr:hypothetical protein [Novosphingobium guangzhouense]
MMFFDLLPTTLRFQSTAALKCGVRAKPEWINRVPHRADDHGQLSWKSAVSLRVVTAMGGKCRRCDKLAEIARMDANFAIDHVFKKY